jgi:hypothetical protein
MHFGGFGAALVGVAFWMFIAAVSIAAIITDHMKRRAALDLIKASIDKGAPLDPKVVEALMHSQQESQRVQPEQLRLGGIITIAGGAGVGILGACVAQISDAVLYPALGVASLAVCVGAGLIYGARVLAESQARASNKSSM